MVMSLRCHYERLKNGSLRLWKDQRAEVHLHQRFCRAEKDIAKSTSVSNDMNINNSDKQYNSSQSIITLPNKLQDPLCNLIEETLK